jgi:hypothetical protein
MSKMMFLAAFAPLLFLIGCAGSEPAPYVRTSQVEIYRSAPAPDPTMAALCRQLERDADQASIHNKTEVEEYTTTTNSGDEYSRQSHESSRYSETAKVRDEMRVLCTQLE